VEVTAAVMNPSPKLQSYLNLWLSFNNSRKRRLSDRKIVRKISLKSYGGFLRLKMKSKSAASSTCLRYSQRLYCWQTLANKERSKALKMKAELTLMLINKPLLRLLVNVFKPRMI
jgi:hypothetical protein